MQLDKVLRYGLTWFHGSADDDQLCLKEEEMCFLNDVSSSNIRSCCSAKNQTEQQLLLTCVRYSPMEHKGFFSSAYFFI
jgi:hypothetical protein